MTAVGPVLRKSVRVKPYYLCHGGLRPAAKLVAHEQCRYDAGKRRRAETRFSNGIFCNIAAFQINPSKFKHMFQYGRSRD